jgi:hypothetical protein
MQVPDHPFSNVVEIDTLNRMISIFGWTEKKLGRNPLDAIIENLGGYEKVAEVIVFKQ